MTYGHSIGTQKNESVRDMLVESAGLGRNKKMGTWKRIQIDTQAKCKHNYDTSRDVEGAVTVLKCILDLLQ